MLKDLSDQEVAILLATKISANTQTAVELASTVEVDVERAVQTVTVLGAKNILESIKQWDGSIVYHLPGNAYAQNVYEEIYKFIP